MLKGSPVWQASSARANFSEVIDAALGGNPQTIRKRSGEEVVVLSRDAYDALRPTMRDVLLRGGTGPDKNDPIDAAIAETRRRGATLFGVVSRSGRGGRGRSGRD